MRGRAIDQGRTFNALCDNGEMECEIFENSSSLPYLTGHGRW